MMNKTITNLNQRLKNVREAVANNTLENLPINQELVDRLTEACENNEQLDAEVLINEFVNQSTKY